MYSFKVQQDVFYRILLKRFFCPQEVSNKNTNEKKIFGSWKQREGVEQSFDTFKTMLQSDILYLQDDESVFGHIFVAGSLTACSRQTYSLKLKVKVQHIHIQILLWYYKNHKNR